MQRITFWLNSNMANGNTAGISVTVGGITSNMLSFTIDNTAKSMFIDPVNGNDAWDGLYKDNSLGGTHGPFRSIFTLTKRASLTPGTFLYMRAGTYTNICSGCSSSNIANIGYFETGTMYYPQQDGTDALHLTLTSYPGEHARWFNAIAYNSSNYWTFTNFTIEGNASLPEPSGNTLSWGDQWAMCSYSNGGTAWRSKGLDVIGMSFIGAHHHTIQAFGDNFRIVGNNLNMSPLGSAGTGDYTADTAYNLYLGAGDNMVVADNYISGAGYYLIHSFDENRCNSNADTNRHMHNRVIESNWIDMNRKTSVSSPIQPRPIRAGLLIGDWSTNGGTPQVTDFHVRNNIFYSSDGLVSEGGVKMDIVSGNYNGIYIYNNTFLNASINNGPSDTGVVFLSYTSGGSVSNLSMKNNIIVGNRTYDYTTQGTSETSTIQNNLLDQAWRGDGDAVSGNITGSPGFIDQSGGDFHPAAASLARNAGQNLYASFTRDYDYLGRPSSAAFDIGAFEYISGVADTTAPASPTGLLVN